MVKKGFSSIIRVGKKRKGNGVGIIKLIIVASIFLFFMWSVVYVHERIHQKDFKALIDKGLLENGTLCVLNTCPSVNGVKLAGSYTAFYSKNISEEGKEKVRLMLRNSEIKAYAFSIAYLILVMIIVLAIMRG